MDVMDVRKEVLRLASVVALEKAKEALDRGDYETFEDFTEEAKHFRLVFESKVFDPEEEILFEAFERLVQNLK